MNGDLRLTDELLRDMFERRARRGTVEGLRGLILTTTGATGQRTRRLRLLAGGRAPMRLLAVAALIATVGAGLFTVASRPPQQATIPLTRVATFVRPFDYADVPDSGLGTANRYNAYFVTFSAGGDEAYPSGGGGTLLPGARGITISSAEGVSTHPCPGGDEQSSRGRVREDPDGFVDDLRSVAGAGIGGPSAMTFDGRTAIAVAVDPESQRCGDADVHVMGSRISSGFVRLNVPSRLVVTRVDGMTIVLQAWAATPGELDAWMPKATEFLDHIHFTGDSYP